jgi:hypothetical protein
LAFKYGVLSTEKIMKTLKAIGVEVFLTPLNEADLEPPQGKLGFASNDSGATEEAIQWLVESVGPGMKILNESTGEWVYKPLEVAPGDVVFAGYTNEQLRGFWKTAHTYLGKKYLLLCGMKIDEPSGGIAAIVERKDS